MIKKVFILLLIFPSMGVFADEITGITGAVEWDTLCIKSTVSLDLLKAGIKLPSGRTQGESILESGYLRLIQPNIMDIQVDSSTTIADLIIRGEFSLEEAENLALKAQSVPPALSTDLKKISSSYTMNIYDVSAALLRHNRASPIMRTLTPVSSAQYTGIIIIADDKLPLYGMRTSALAVPCLFPKIWDSNMNLIYERNMLETRSTTMVRYAPSSGIFQENPSGLAPEVVEAAGNRPLRIFAKALYGINPTDIIIDNSDAMLIISSNENRRLLSEGKVVFIVNDSVLKKNFSR
ncbi:MAG: polymerase [Treponema sp.]|nr:polymerase [Treponema sp.]